LFRENDQRRPQVRRHYGMNAYILNGVRNS
jgi:hypothetical protein